MTTRISITDDHEMVCQGIASMLSATKELEMVASYHDAASTLEQLPENLPDVLLLDINLPDANGIDLCKELLKKHPALKIIALSNFDEVSFVKRIIQNGAHGYLLKNTDRLELIEAIKTVLAGEQYLQKDIQRKLLNHSLGQSKPNAFHIKLTRREQEVLEAMAEELTTQEISEKLFISPKTVETHRMNLMSKLGAKNSVGIIKTAMERGLLG